MSKKTESESQDDLKAQVDELTKVLSALISDIDNHRPESCDSCYWWKASFLKDLDISDGLKRKLGLIIDDEDEEE